MIIKPHFLKCILGTLICLLFSTFAIAQSKQNNPEKILSLKAFYKQIFDYHPIVKQAKLLTDYAKQELRIARGQFDFKLNASYESKAFDNKNYYNHWNSYVKIPTWIGDFKVGHENNSGFFLNEENFTPRQGLNYAGVTLPLLQNLIIDERRTILQQARFFGFIAEAEKLKSINKVLISAAKDYWEWYFSYHQFLLSKEGLNLAQIRFDAVKQRVVQGDLAPIDSVEAKITLQDRDILLRQADIELQNMRLILSNYFWDTNETPLELQNDVVPEIFNATANTFSSIQLQELQINSEKNHPEIVKLTYKIKQLEVEQKLATNNLLPRLDFTYNFLNSTITGGNQEFMTPFSHNYKSGVYFEFPLFLRKQRGKLQQTRIKQIQTNFDKTQTIREIKNELQALYNNLTNINQLIDIQTNMVQNYTLLRNAEQQKFEIGESTLFLINSRESKLIEGQVKLEALKSKYEKERLMLLWAAGVPLWEL